MNRSYYKPIVLGSNSTKTFLKNDEKLLIYREKSVVGSVLVELRLNVSGTRHASTIFPDIINRDITFDF
ncbi:hypothetical protein HZS_6350 [Henneguya salminicola]|nr:hypothetical protein HZS_6350 [Henneguya salminicola]